MSRISWSPITPQASIKAMTGRHIPFPRERGPGPARSAAAAPMVPVWVGPGRTRMKRARADLRSRTTIPARDDGGAHMPSRPLGLAAAQQPGGQHQQGVRDRGRGWQHVGVQPADRLHDHVLGQLGGVERHIGDRPAGQQRGCRDSMSPGLHRDGGCQSEVTSWVRAIWPGSTGTRRCPLVARPTGQATRTARRSQGPLRAWGHVNRSRLNCAPLSWGHLELEPLERAVPRVCGSSNCGPPSRGSSSGWSLERGSAELRVLEAAVP